MIEVVKAGLLDLVMDTGRPGFRVFGVPPGGAADGPSLIRANRLVGNPDDAAGLEITLAGPELAFADGAVVAYVGADLGASLDGAAMRPGCRHEVAAGARLKFGCAAAGLRAYLAVAGGIDVPPLLGSRSTFLPGGWGGWHGRALRVGDQLPVGSVQPGNPWAMLAGEPVAASSPLRILPGPQLRDFDDTSVAGFLAQPYEVHPDSNRVGVRLKGGILTFTGHELPSQPVLPGAVQVPPDGQPIIVGWDGPVTGGYPVIAGVIAADLPRLAQLRPGDSVRFRAISAEAARLAWQTEKRWLV